MAIRRFNQIGVAGVAKTVRPKFRRPSTPIKTGDTVVLKYTDGRIDTVIAVRHTHTTGCMGCIYDEAGTPCPCYIDQAGFICCIFGGSSYAVPIENVLEGI
jgi:hypothetical protein